MSEEKKTRALETIQQEYQSLCVKAGHLQYQIHAINKDLEAVNSTLRDLNFEAAAAANAASQKTSGTSEVASA